MVAARDMATCAVVQMPWKGTRGLRGRQDNVLCVLGAVGVAVSESVLTGSPAVKKTQVCLVAVILSINIL